MSLFGNKKTEEKKPKSAKTESDSSAVKKEKKPASMKELYGESAKKTAVVAADNSSVAKKSSPSLAGRVLVKPLVTEKGSNMVVENKYLFAVSNKTNKIDIEKAIIEAYGIKPLKVNIINVGGKTKRQGRVIGKRKDWKKAIVTLPKGKTIQVYEGI
jgi:large subunit ribosomal protein L23